MAALTRRPGPHDRKTVDSDISMAEPRVSPHPTRYGREGLVACSKADDKIPYPLRRPESDTGVRHDPHADVSHAKVPASPPRPGAIPSLFSLYDSKIHDWPEGESL